MIDIVVAVPDAVAAMGLQAVLDEADDLKVVARTEDPDRIRTLVAEHEPDVVLLDVSFRRADPELVPDLAGMEKPCKVLVHVDHGPDECAVCHMLEVGGRARLSREAVARLDECCLTSLNQMALGCLAQGTSPEGGRRTVRTVAAGEVAAAPWLTALATTLGPTNGHGRDKPSAISVRELEVMTFLAKGDSNKEIAKAMGIREQTVKNHVARIMEKLGARNRMEVGLLAAKHHLRLEETSSD